MSENIFRNSFIILTFFLSACVAAPLVSEPALPKPAHINNYLDNTTYDNVIAYLDYLIFTSTWPRPKFSQFYFKNSNPKWYYGDAVMNTALNEFYRYTNDSRYLDFIKGYYHYYVSEDLTIQDWTPDKHSLDDFTPARALFDLHEYTGLEWYITLAEQFFNNFLTYPRTDEGSFYHRDPRYVDEVWLDGLYMAMPFYARYGTLYTKNANYDDILLQFRNCHKHLFNSTVGLYYHGYARKNISWADPVTGHSQCFWGRGNGWYINALLDVVQYADPRETAFVKELSDMAKEHLLGFISHIELETQMIFEVVDQASRAGNYPETSASAELCYAVLHAVSLGILDASYIPTAVSLFNGICKRYLKVGDDGDWHLGGIVWQAGLGVDGDQNRDGTYEYYISSDCEVLDDDAKGSGFFVLAFLEICKLAK